MKNLISLVLATACLSACGITNDHNALHDIKAKEPETIDLPATADEKSLQAQLAKIFSDKRVNNGRGDSLEDSRGNKISCAINKSQPVEYSCRFKVTAWPNLPESLAEKLADLLPAGKFPTQTKLVGSNGNINCMKIAGGVEHRLDGSVIGRPSMSQCYVTLDAK